jgi:uncharacterized delta-60 repeat protein
MKRVTRCMARQATARRPGVGIAAARTLATAPWASRGSALVVLLALLSVAPVFASPCASECDVARDLAIDSAGRIVVVGGTAGPSSWRIDRPPGLYLALWRFNDDGTPDATFGNGGVVLGAYEGAALSVVVENDGTLSVPYLSSGGITVGSYGPDGEAYSRPSSAADVPYDGRMDYGYAMSGHSVAVDHSGHIVLVYNAGWDDVDPTVTRRLELRRFAPDGTEDAAFAGVSPPSPAMSQGKAIAIDDAGRIVVTGSSDAGMTVWRFDPDGVPDAEFGEGGVVSLPHGGSTYRDSGEAVAIDEAGRLLVTGLVSSENGHALALWRFAPDGHLDPSFAEVGLITATVSRPEREYGADGRAILFDSEFRIVVLGAYDGRPVIWRYLPDGTPDDTFGEGGQVALEDYITRLASLWVRAMILDPSGRIVMAGNLPCFAEYDVAVCRLNPDGSLDRSFGIGGAIIYDCNQGFRRMPQ